MDAATEADTEGWCSEPNDLLVRAAEMHADAADEWERCIGEEGQYGTDGCIVDTVGIEEADPKLVAESAELGIRTFRLGKRWERAGAVQDRAQRATAALR